MKLFLSLFLLLAVSTFGAVPSYDKFFGTGGIIVTTNPPNGTVVIDGSSVVGSGAGIRISTNATTVTAAATNINFTPGNNAVLKGTNIDSAAHLNIGIASNLTFNTGLGPVIVGSWGDVWGVSNTSLQELALWLPEIDSSSEVHFADSIVVGGTVVATNVQLTAIPGTGTNVGITAGGSLFRMTAGGGTVSAGQSVSVVTNGSDYQVSVGLKDLLMSGTNRLTFSNGVGFAMSPDGITNNALYLIDTDGTHPALIWPTSIDGTFHGVGLQPNPDFATILDVVTTYTGTSLGTLRMYSISLTNAAAVGKVWTATSTDGSGAWSNATAGGSGILTINENSAANQFISLNTGIVSSIRGPIMSNSINGVEFYFPWSAATVNGFLHSNDWVRFNVGSTQMVVAAIGTLQMTNHIIYAGSNVGNIGTLLNPSATNFMMAFQMHPNARRNLQLRSDDNGFGSWGVPQSGGNGNIAGGAESPVGGIQFGQTNVAGLHMMLDSTNNLVYWRNVNELAVTNTGGTSNTVIGAGYIRAQLLEVNNLNVNTLIVTNGISAAGGEGQVQYNSDSLLDAEAAFHYSAATDTLTVTSLVTHVITVRSNVGAGKVLTDTAGTGVGTWQAAAASTTNFLAISANHASINAVAVSNTITVSNLTATAPGSSIVGVTNGGNAAAGVIGEHISSAVANIAVGPNSVFTNTTSIALTPGDWDVSALTMFLRDGATFNTVTFYVAISASSGTSTAGEVLGNNVSDDDTATPITFVIKTLSVPAYRFNTPTNATIYLKSFVGDYTLGTPKMYGRISARRMR